ncbi:MAG: membrane dipeptidase [Acidobacteriota bacterium]
MRSILLFVLCSLCACPVYSQHMAVFGGTVRDLVTQAAIESVRVAVVNMYDPSERFTALTDAQGGWSLNFPVTDVTRDDPAAPSQFILSQNYPNPFNPSTRIQFYAPRPGTVTITVHTALGEELDRKEVGVQAGLSEIEWESKGSAGVLFYTLEFEKHRVTKKMIQLDGGAHNGLGAVRTVGGAPRRSMAKSASPIGYFIIPSKLGYETDTTRSFTVVNPYANLTIETVHNRAFVIDLHNDVMEKVLQYGYDIAGPRRSAAFHTDLPGMKQGGVDAQMFSIWIDPDTSGYFFWADSSISIFEAQVARNSNAIELARTADGIGAAAAKKKIAAVFGLEGGHAIEHDLSKLIRFYERGVRYLTITWNNSTDWATSAGDPLSATKGLSDFGRQVIRTMDSLGMIIDVSHTGVKTIDDILAVTKNPIIASHSGVRALRNHTRNLTDAQIKAIAARGGVIGVVFYPPFLSTYPSTKVTLDTVVKHIDYIKNLVGVDAIALGSDFDGIETWPAGLENVTKFPDLTMALLKKGYTPADVRKILGENYMRVFKTVCH